MGKKMMKPSNEAAITSSSGKNWSMLPDDVLRTILEKLIFPDRLNAILSCKGWKLFQIPATSRSFLPWIIEQHWSMITVSSSERYLNCTAKLHQPHNPELYSTVYRTFDLPHCGTGIIIPPFPFVPLVKDTKLGWLLLEIPSTGLLVLYNPFVVDDDYYEATGLPPLLNKVIYQATFSCPPTSPDCIVFAVTKSRRKRFGTINTWCRGDEDWKQYKGPEFVSDYSAVAMDRTLYCLDAYHRMVIFNSTNSALKTVSTPIDAGLEQEGYLAAAVNGGGLLLVVYDKQFRSGSFKVYRYYTATNWWAPRQRLDGQALFLDRRHPHHCAYAAPAPAQKDYWIYDGFKANGKKSCYSYADINWPIDSSGHSMFPSYHQKPCRLGDVFISMV